MQLVLGGVCSQVSFNSVDKFVAFDSVFISRHCLIVCLFGNNNML